MSTGEAARRPLPEWFDDVKFGLMVYWLPSAVPAFAPVGLDPNELDFRDPSFDEVAFFSNLPYSEMYLNSMHIEGSPTARHHEETYGGRSYDEFGERFLAGVDDWDPEPWVDLFAQAGARYIVLSVKHQDGFLLWPSAIPHPRKPNWQTKRDVLGEIAAGVRARGLRFGVLYTGGTDLTFSKPGFKTLAEMKAAVPQDQEFSDYVDAHWRELIERYELDILWNDMGYPAAANREALIEWYRDRLPRGVVNDRFGADVGGDRIAWAETDPYTDFATLEYQSNHEKFAPSGRKWEACRGIGTSFGYNREESDEDYASSTELIHELCDCVARGGNFLLAVGATAAGNIPWPQAKRLVEIGWWLRENGDAIYGTRPWARPDGRAQGGLEVRYTQSQDAVHAIVLGSPAEAWLEVDVALDDGAQVTLEGRESPLDWEATAGGVRIELPEIPDPRPAAALRLSPASAVRPA